MVVRGAAVVSFILEPVSVSVIFIVVSVVVMVPQVSLEKQFSSVVVSIETNEKPKKTTKTSAATMALIFIYLYSTPNLEKCLIIILIVKVTIPIDSVFNL